MEKISDAIVTPSKLARFNRLRSLLGIFDIEQMQRWWNSHAALNLSDALSVKELIAREWSYTQATSTRFQNYLQQFKHGKTMGKWTFYLIEEYRVCVMCLWDYKLNLDG